MSTDILMHGAAMQQLNDFYQMMLSQQIIKATEVKKEIDEKIEQIKHAEQKENQKAGYPILDVQEGKEFWKTSKEKRSRITTPF
ncbi:hypothetical protein IEC_05410 [Bacillus toyonensis]|uniref:response regulator aspartate phosphatase n=1 Tax=Bacillus sp. FDAARGOS_235 TaxID=1839798 RepID=UPI000278BECA|nr:MULTISPECIES: hypothetical protein [Bacillus cereus group]EJQ32398.1 hypothetical protein IEC_05410 [Bacillus toyonensis]MCG3797082.1 hypothetical protein [Bacillus toyonensis]PEC39848.1 hypothetical protein CON60_08810 [Bacillus toyonensis]PED58239.1 hypothetical protein CON89_27435 [Bacillus toyonensis]PEF96477.1 hypothetical protein COO01_24275 [Bacillus toyonensis]